MEAAEDAYFLTKTPVKQIFIHLILFDQHAFDGHILRLLQVLTQVNFAHATRAKVLEHLETAVQNQARINHGADLHVPRLSPGDEI